MNSKKMGLLFAVSIAMAVAAAPAFAQDSPQRKEIKRADLSGAPGMEVINSVSEYNPGEEIGLHIHHGVESGYFIQGGTVQSPGKQPMVVPDGAPILNLRGVPHAGFKVVGDKTLKIFTVHIVDKGKPLYDYVK